MALLSCQNASLNYTAFYCEENIWQLCHRIQSQEREEIDNCYVVFISNSKEMVAIWGQKAGDLARDHLVVWDYHVILIHCNNKETSHVYDFDTVLSFPVCFKEYCNNNFRIDKIHSSYHYSFRVIPAAQFLQTFASDRSRMRDKDGNYIKPPPLHDCIRTVNETNNLNQFISMEPGFPVGEILNLAQLRKRFSLIR